MVFLSAAQEKFHEFLPRPEQDGGIGIAPSRRGFEFPSVRS